MRAGNFRNPLDDIQLAAHDQFHQRTGGTQYGKSHILADVADVEKALVELKLRPGTQALDVATGNGHTAICLAEKGCSVTACDISEGMLAQSAAAAGGREKSSH